MLKGNIKKYITKQFRKRFMGLVLDNSKGINKVYTAVFPNDYVIDRLRKEKDVLLLTHHPMRWDDEKGFTSIPKKNLKLLKKNRISLYTLHVPLDKNGRYSTAVNFAKKLELKKEGEFFPYHGVKVGVYGKLKEKKFKELIRKVQKTVNHKVKAYNYGKNRIRAIGIVGGGGADKEAINQLKRLKVDSYITGVTQPCKGYRPSFEERREFHAAAKAAKINVIDASHYPLKSSA